MENSILENAASRENVLPPANPHFVSVEGEKGGKYHEEDFENVEMLTPVSEMMMKTAEFIGCPVLRDGELRAAKCLTPGLSFAWGAKTVEDMKRLRDFVGLPFIYYSTKENYAPGPPNMKEKEMVLKLTQFNQTYVVEDLTVKLSDDSDELNKFCDVIAECFKVPMEKIQPLPPRYNLLAYQRGVLVGGLIVDIYEQSSIIYFNSVLPKYRCQNISKAVMAEAIKLAKEKGAKEMVLYSSPLGKPVYERLGFKCVKEYDGVYVMPSGATKSNETLGSERSVKSTNGEEGREQEETTDNAPEKVTGPV